MRLSYAPCRLRFKEPATTSRDTMTEKLTCFIKVYDESNPEVYGLGEAAIFPGLSPEADADYELKLLELLANVAATPLYSMASSRLCATSSQAERGSITPDHSPTARTR